MNEDDGSPKIYLLPNLMTAGNLFCGFAATLRIMEGALLENQGGNPVALYHAAIWFILGACIFDLLDGRVARMGGHESPFGREFDSIADIVSFGLAPSLLIYRIVLRESTHFGWLIAFLYLVCGALRLARFNCIAAANLPGGDKEFKGFPIPAAAGLIASLTLFVLWWQAGEHGFGYGRYLFPPLMVFLAFMMFSRVRYPSFKAVNWHTKKSIPRFIVIISLLVFTAINYEWMPAIIFLAYLLYGFGRPWISRKWQREIEEEDDEDETPAATL